MTHFFQFVQASRRVLSSVGFLRFPFGYTHKKLNCLYGRFHFGIMLWLQQLWQLNMHLIVSNASRPFLGINIKASMNNVTSMLKLGIAARC